MKTKLLLLLLIISGWSVNAQTSPVIEGDIMMCPWTEGTATVTNPPYDTYQWYFKYWFLADDYVAIEGATGASFTYDWYTYDQALLKVVTTLNGETYESNNIQVDSYAWLELYVMFELTPEVTFDPETESYILCEGSTFMLQIDNPPYDTLFQWYNNGEPIPGATSDHYGITKAGSYTVSAAPSFCPGSISTTGIPIVVSMRDCTTGVSDINTNINRIYPNPVSGILNIDLPGNTVYKHCSIMDITGKVLQDNSLKSNSNTISFEDLPKGLYLLKLSGDNHYITRQIIRQ